MLYPIELGVRVSCSYLMTCGHSVNRFEAHFIALRLFVPELRQLTRTQVAQALPIRWIPNRLTRTDVNFCLDTFLLTVFLFVSALLMSRGRPTESADYARKR